MGKKGRQEWTVCGQGYFGHCSSWPVVLHIIVTTGEGEHGKFLHREAVLSQNAVAEPANFVIFTLRGLSQKKLTTVSVIVTLRVGVEAGTLSILILYIMVILLKMWR